MYDSRMDHDAPDPDIELQSVFRTGESDLIAMAKSVLEAENIEYYVRAEGVQQLFGGGSLGSGYNLFTGPADFVVRAEDAERAKELLEPLTDGIAEVPDEDEAS